MTTWAFHPRPVEPVQTSQQALQAPQTGLQSVACSAASFHFYASAQRPCRVVVFLVGRRVALHGVFRILLLTRAASSVGGYRPIVCTGSERPRLCGAHVTRSHSCSVARAHLHGLTRPRCPGPMAAQLVHLRAAVARLAPPPPACSIGRVERTA